jgi:hypothetical protein
MANNAEPARVAVIGLGYWGPNLVRNFAAACPPSAFVRRIEGIF